MAILKLIQILTIPREDPDITIFPPIGNGHNQSKKHIYDFDINQFSCVPFMNKEGELFTTSPNS